MTTLAYAAVTITLHDDLLWTDEYRWKPIEQKTSYSLTGALLVEAAAKSSGRPITLEGGDAYGWTSRSVVDALMTAAGIAGQQFTLTLRGVAHTVVFDHGAGPVEATPVIDYSNPDAADLYRVTLRFLKV